MTARPQSWRGMNAAPRAFIATVVLCGLSVLTYAAVLHGKSQNPVKFFCYLVIAIAASRLKELVLTDTIQATEAIRVSNNIRVVSIAPLIGEAIARIAKEESVSSLFD